MHLRVDENKLSNPHNHSNNHTDSNTLSILLFVVIIKLAQVGNVPYQLSVLVKVQVQVVEKNLFFIRTVSFLLLSISISFVLLL